MDNRAFLSLSSIAITVLIILLIIPEGWSVKSAGAIGAIGTVILAFGIILTVDEYHKEVVENDINDNEAAFVELQKLFLTDESIHDFYQEIYGKQKNVKMHVLITLMAQRIQDINDDRKFSSQQKLPVDDEFVNLFKSWVNTKTFKEIWPTISKYYKPETYKFIRRLQTE